MTEIAEVALYFAIGGWLFALLWGFFIVAWRARNMMVAYLESKRAGRIWKAAESHIVPPILERVSKMERTLNARLDEGQILDLGERLAKLENRLETFARLEEEVMLAVKGMNEAKSMLMGNLAKMRHGVERLEELETQAARAAAAQLGLEAQDADPGITQKLSLSRIAARLDPNDPSLSMIEAAGIVFGKEALMRAERDGVFKKAGGVTLERSRRNNPVSYDTRL